MRRTVILLVLSVLLLIGGAATAAGTYYQRGIALRGWTDPTATGELPRRLPLAGVNVELTQYDPAALDQELDHIAGAGFTWIRQNFLWSEIEKTQGSYDFSRYDGLIDAVSRHPALKLVAVLNGTPNWARRPDSSD